MSGQPYCYECGVDREGDWLCDACRPETTDTSDARITETEAENEAWKEWHSKWIDERRELLSLRAAQAERERRRQNVICLCGSTCFKEQFLAEALRLELNGHIALSMTQFEHADSIEVTAAQKTEYDALHRRKIDLADEVHVINVAGYIGESTASEIAYAESLGKSVTYIEPPRRTDGGAK